MALTKKKTGAPRRDTGGGSGALQTFSSAADIKKDLKSGGGGMWFTRVQPDTELTVRFMAEPDDGGIASFWNHFDDTRPKGKQAYPCNAGEGDCVGCDEGVDRTKVYIAPCIDVSNNQVIVLQMTKTVIESLLKKYERHSTLLDRDYIIARTGSGRENTSYEVDADERRKRDLSRYDLPDMGQMIQDQIEFAMSDEEEEQPRQQRRKPGRSAPPPGRRPPRGRTYADDDDEDEDDEPPRRAVKRVVKKPAAIKKLADKGKTLRRR